MKSNFDAELQRNSDAVNESDMTDAHIRDLTAALAADPPADFTKRVMKEIRAERKKIAYRHRILRFGSAVAAALVIVPMAAIVVPAMIRGEKNVDAAPLENDAALYLATDAGTDSLLYTTDVPEEDMEKAGVPSNGLPGNSMADESPAATEAPAPEAEAVATSAPAAAPDHMSRPQESPAGMGTTAETFATDPKYTMNALPETPAITVLRAVIGSEKLDTWLAKQDDTEESSVRAIILAFDVRWEDFLTAAEDLQLTFTQDELAEWFETPLTEK